MTSGEKAVPPRRLRIVVSTLPIEDGTTRPPAVGEVGHYLLTFREIADESDDAPMITEVRARAEPQGDGSPLGPGYQWDGTPHEGPTTWPTVLHGDGWSAFWAAPRPVLGQVRLRGVLGDHLDIDARTGVRGRVDRVQVITETIDTSATDQRDWRPIPAERRLRDVEVAPRWFDDGRVIPSDRPTPEPPVRFVFGARVPADPYVVETGVLVDLDLDHVPHLPVRPSIVPGSLDACGPDLWVVDTRLPLVVRVTRPLDDDPEEVTAFRWDGRILGSEERRTVHADGEGCWVTGPDGVHRVDGDGVHQVDDARVGLAAVHQGALLAATGTPTLRRYSPDGTPLDVDLGDRAVVGLVAGGDGFLVVLSRTEQRGDPMPTPEQRRPWLATVDAAGAVREGPPLELRRTWDRLVAGDPPLVRDHVLGGTDRLRPVQDDLTLGEGSAPGRRVLGAVGVGGRLWITMHPPHPLDIERLGAAAYWPLSRPPTYPDERQYWLLTEVTPGTLEPVVSTLVPRLPDRVAVDDTGTAWVLADGVRRVPREDGAAAVPLDVAALLDRATPDQAP